MIAFLLPIVAAGLLGSPPRERVSVAGASSVPATDRGRDQRFRNGGSDGGA